MIDKEEICKAIRGRHYVRLYYQNHESGWHIVEPYVLGEDHSGNLILAAWQWKGTIGENSQGIQYYSVEAIKEFQIDSATFHHPQPAYNFADTRFRNVVCDLLISGRNPHSTYKVPSK
jgi:hypothetical protein